MEQGVAVSAASLLQLHLIQPEQLHARRRNCLEYGCGRVGVRVGRPLVGRPSSTQLRKGTLTVAHLVTGRQGGSSAWRGGGGGAPDRPQKGGLKVMHGACGPY